MKLNAFILLFVLSLVSLNEANAQHRRYDNRNYRYRYAPRPYVRVMPRIIIPTPSFGFSWGYGPRIYVSPPPIILGRGLGWRHYHGRGYGCNDRCHRWSDDNYYRNQNRSYDDDRRYNDNRDRRYDNNNQDNRRYEDNDRYYNRNNSNPTNTKPKTYNTDEDSYEEVIDTI